MALCIPIHLRQRTSRVYQDHPTISDQVLTSLVPPVHNQGVSSAPLQGHALWNIFLPTTGSFFVCFITDFLPATALSVDVFLLHSDFYTSSYRGWSQHSSILYSNAQANHDIRIPDFLCRHYSSRPYDIAQHLLAIIIYTFCQYRVEDPDQLARNRYD